MKPRINPDIIKVLKEFSGVIFPEYSISPEKQHIHFVQIGDRKVLVEDVCRQLITILEQDELYRFKFECLCRGLKDRKLHDLYQIIMGEELQ